MAWRPHGDDKWLEASSAEYGEHFILFMHSRMMREKVRICFTEYVAYL